MSSHNSQKEAKKALRSDIKSRLSQLSTQDLTAQSEKAQNIILNSSQYQNARRVGIYLSMPQSEAQTDILIRDALSSSQAKKVCVPYIYSVKNDDATSKKRTTKVMDMLQLETIEEYAGLEKDGWGIPKLSDQGIEQRENAMGWKGLSSMDADGSRVENEGDAAREAGLDLIVVPAVAFDRELNRLGHGAGFYDKFLTRNFGDGKSKKPYLFGLCLAEQIVPEGKLVMEPWDWRVDAVAVGDGTLLTSDDIQ
ncbi:uncharacterized protein RHO25_005751 [Cercospora beticola]|nr:hypothetical protein RHO25_005751 [Cercospora beticola]